MAENYFKELYAIDLRDQVKQKNGLNYCPWAVAWARAKELYPDATYQIHRRTTPDGLLLNYFTDGKTCWVTTDVTINGITHTEDLACMDYRNQSINLENLTSYDVIKSIQRCLTKALARHGLGLYLYEGEDMPSDIKEMETLQEACMELIKKKSALSEKTKDKVAEVCKAADEEANGDPRLITDIDVLKTLKKSLMAIRKVT